MSLFLRSISIETNFEIEKKCISDSNASARAFKKANEKSKDDNENIYMYKFLFWLREFNALM